MKRIVMYGIFWLVSLGAQAQEADWVLNDLAYALESPANRQEVVLALQQFQESTQVGLLVSAEFEQGVYATDARQVAAIWLQGQTHGITVLITLTKDTKAFQKCEMQVSDAVEALLPAEDRQQIRTGLMEFYFRSSPIPTDAYTQGLLAGIEAIEKKILESRENEKEKLPDDVVTITHMDKEFAAGIDDDKLEIEYAIKEEFVGTLKAAKLEVYKDLAKEPCFVTTLDIEETNTYLWDGKLSEEDGDYITYKDSPFTVKITVSEDEKFEKVGFDTEETSVHAYIDEFRMYKNTARHIPGKTDAEKFESYKKLKAPLYSRITNNETNRILATLYSHPLKYLSDNVKEQEFLGRKVWVHKNYYPHLQDIQNALNKNYDSYYMNHSNYTFGGFSIRLQSGSSVKVSNHAFGMALDVDAAYNPQLYRRPLFLISLITNADLMVKSTPGEMKYMSEQFQRSEITSQKLQSMKVGFEVIDSYHEENDAVPIGDIIEVYRQLNQLFRKVHDLRDRTIHLSNERNFIDNRVRYTTRQAEAVELEFYQTIPQKCTILKEEILEKWGIEKLKKFSEVLRNGYSPAMRLPILFPEVHEGLERDFVALDNFSKTIQTLDGIILATSSHQIRSDIANTIEQVSTLSTSESSIEVLLEFINLTTKNYRNAFGPQLDFKELITWLENGKVYSFKSNSNLETTAFFEELSQIGFMRMDVDFVNEFLSNNSFIEEDIIDWGGYWTSKKDWMHLEYVENNRFIPK